MRKNLLAFQIVMTLLLSGCIKDRLPKVLTLPISDTTWIDATCGGNVLDEGSSAVFARGLCISTRNPPTVTEDSESNFTVDGSGVGSFTSTITFRGTNIHLPVTTRYIRAYATNKQGTSYGQVQICYPKYKPPVFVTFNLVNETSNSASFNVGLEVSSSGQVPSELDLCYSTIPAPTILDNHVSILNMDQKKINNLLPNTIYFVRAYAKNSGGEVYSSEISFTTWEGEITDKSGNHYQIKTIGNNVWTVNNLETSKFDDGSDIPLIQEDFLWGTTVISAYSTYTGYGKLYNYYAVTDNRKLCPSGWNIPSDSDWKSLELFLGMSPDQVNAIGQRGTDEGGKLKYINTSVYDGWNFPNVGATNTSGFSALGAGYRNSEGIFANENASANFWTSTEYDSLTAWSRSLYLSNSQIVRTNINKKYGLSVRCIKSKK